MATFQKCESDVEQIVDELLHEYQTHRQTVEAEVKVDLIFAFANVDEDGEKKGVALKLHGIRALGITKATSLKDRVMGRGDVEILLDGDWWKTATIEEQRALVDHELTHIEVCVDEHGVIETDDYHRPIVKMRKHDYEFGWFNVIAERHGRSSIERQQAAIIMDGSGQYYWPTVASRPSAGRLEVVDKNGQPFTEEKKAAAQ